MGGEWRTILLGDLIESGRAISYGIVQPGYHDPAGVPIVRVGDIRGGRVTTDNPMRVARSIESKFSRTRLRGGELLITLVGTVGETAIATPELEGWNLARAVAIVPIDERVGAPWVKAALQLPAVRSLIKSRLNTTVQATLNLGDVAKIPVIVPPSKDRAVIQNLLGALDDEIELNRRMTETLRAMARALFRSWFVDFDPVQAKIDGRQTGLSTDLQALFPTAIGDNGLPTGWIEVPFGDAMIITKGVSYKSVDLAISRTALVTLKSFARRGGYRNDGLKPFTGTYKNNQIASPGDLIVAATDVTQAAEIVGQPVIVESDPAYDTLVASLDTFIARPKTLPPWFWALALSEQGFVQFARGYTTGTTVLHLSTRVFDDFTFKLPQSGALAAATVQLLKPIIERGCELAKQSQTAIVLRDTLLPRLISGELRIADAERTVAAVA